MSVARHSPAAFDSIAEQYDAVFTCSLVGRAQRNAVWEIARRHFQPGDSILELNCGTGEDALFFAASGMSVLACDISTGMIDVANRHKLRAQLRDEVEFRVLAIEELHTLGEVSGFDGMFSNFSGLNCVADLSSAARQMARLIRHDGRAVLCLTNRLCLWEIAWYGMRGRFRKAFRRWRSNGIRAAIGDSAVTVYYPHLRQILGAFRTHFRVVEICGVGITVPPSYLEPWVRRRKSWLSTAISVDRTISRLPFVRTLGDHVVVVLERKAW